MRFFVNLTPVLRGFGGLSESVAGRSIKAAQNGNSMARPLLPEGRVKKRRPFPRLSTARFKENTKRRNIVMGEQERIGCRWTFWFSPSLQPI